MRRLWDCTCELAQKAIIALFLIFCFARAGHCQQGPPPVLTDVFTEFETKLNPSLDWISEYKAPPIYMQWWSELANCEGLPLPADSLRKVQYFQVNAPTFIPNGVDAIVYGVTYENDQTYVGYSWIWNRSLITHEALHLLLKWSGDPNWYDHGPRFEQCGLRTYGPPPPNSR